MSQSIRLIVYIVLALTLESSMFCSGQQLKPEQRETKSNLGSYTPKEVDAITVNGVSYNIEAASKALVRALSSQDDQRKLDFLRRAKEFRAKLRGGTLISNLISAFPKQDNAEIRSAILELVMFSNDSRMKELCLLAKEDPNAEIRAFAGAWLISNGHKDGFPILTTALSGLDAAPAPEGPQFDQFSVIAVKPLFWIRRIARACEPEIRRHLVCRVKDIICEPRATNNADASNIASLARIPLRLTEGVYPMEEGSSLYCKAGTKGYPSRHSSQARGPAPFHLRRTLQMQENFPEPLKGKPDSHRLRKMDKLVEPHRLPRSKSDTIHMIPEVLGGL